MNGANIQRCAPYGMYIRFSGGYETRGSRFRYDRRHYGYGRILLDVRKFMKAGGKFWNILMGKPLCVSIYHIVTENPDVSIEELLKLDSCPSEYMMDNKFYYGEYEIWYKL